MSQILSFNGADCAIERVALVLRNEAIAGPGDAVQAFADALGAHGEDALLARLEERRAVRQDAMGRFADGRIRPTVALGWRDVEDYGPALHFTNDAEPWPVGFTRSPARVVLDPDTPREALLASVAELAEALRSLPDDDWARLVADARDVAVRADVPF